MAFEATNCTKISGAYRLYYVPVADADTSPTLANLIGTAPVALGITGPEGVRLTREDHIDLIYDDENGPDAPQDAVFRGSSAHLEFVLQDINRKAVYQLLYPWALDSGNSNHAEPEVYGTPGNFACAKYGKLEMIPISGSAAATAANPNNADPGGSLGQGRLFIGLVEGPVVETFDTAARFIPVRFRCFPFATDGADDGTTVLWNWLSVVTP